MPAPANRIGLPRAHLRSTDSTNERARALALKGAPHGTTVTAAEQTAGRGRGGRRWSAPAGRALLMSVLLREENPLLPLAAAVAVCDVCGPRTRVKWPNDIVVERPQGHDAPGAPPAAPGIPRAGAPALGKLGGILIEGRPQENTTVLGIGLNVAVRIEELPPDLRKTAATLGLGPEAIEPLLADLLTALERHMRDPPARTLEEWRARDALRGRKISWSAGRGRADGIDDDGRLRVELQDGTRTALEAGEVHLATAD